MSGQGHFLFALQAEDGPYVETTRVVLAPPPSVTVLTVTQIGSKFPGRATSVDWEHYLSEAEGYLAEVEDACRDPRA